jgi:hypothetical protein
MVDEGAATVALAGNAARGLMGTVRVAAVKRDGGKGYALANRPVAFDQVVEAVVVRPQLADQVFDIVMFATMQNCRVDGDRPPPGTMSQPRAQRDDAQR